MNHRSHTGRLAWAKGGLLRCILVFIAVLVAGSLPSQEVRAAERILSVVAHQDDDLLFINPDLHNAIQAGAVVRTVFVTAGNDEAKGSDYWKLREDGIKAAYAAMKGVANQWTASTISVAGRSAHTVTLNQSGGSVSVVFLRLGSALVPSLDTLWERRDDPSVVLGSMDNNIAVTGEQLIQLLQGLVVQFAPNRLWTLNSSQFHRYQQGGFIDHIEHIVVSQFAVEAYRRTPGPHQHAQYRGYDIYQRDSQTSQPIYYWTSGSIPFPTKVAEEPENLSVADFQNKLRAADAYFTVDTFYGPCNNGAQGWCNTNDPSQIYAAWLKRRYTTVGIANNFLGSDFGDLDFGEHPSYLATLSLNGAAKYASTLRLADVNGDAYPDACLRRWDGIRCAVNQAGAFLPHVSYSADFSDARGWTEPRYATTIQFADINRDGKADVCGRGSAGIWCATAKPAGTGFEAVRLWSADFSDAAGWGGLPSHYRSIRLADVDGDGYPDVCGRGSSGIVCAFNNRQGAFGPVSWVLSSDFDNARLWHLPEHGTTIQFGDVNGDARADVCGRGVDGIICALSTGQAFGPADRWTADFSNSQGWTQDHHYGSIRLADVNRDGRADVCGRGSSGVVCALSSGQGFGPNFLLTPEFSNAGGWGQAKYGGTLQFGDLDRNTALDVCGRGANTLVCVRR